MKMNDVELRELDAWIAANVFGWSICDDHAGFCFYPTEVDKSSIPRHCETPPRYTTDPAAAMQVLEKCIKNCSKDCKTVSFRETGECYIVFARDSYDQETAEAETLPLAICLFCKSLYEKKNA